MPVENELFINRVREYFGDDYENYLRKLEESESHAFFLNTHKASKGDILSIIDFKIWPSEFSDESYYYDCDSIGKSKVYELGLIYPQDVAASLSSAYIDTENIHTFVDMCAAPGGKTIDILNRIKRDVLCIANDYSHSRALTLSSNLERLGFSNVIITNKNTKELSEQLENFADLVILDAPCSGEGMIRKYPEILDTYSINNIHSLATLQKELLDNAYTILKPGGQLIYSTCTYAFEEDEDQVSSFLERYPDIELINIDLESSSKLKGTVKLSPLFNTEGQFFALMRKKGKGEDNSFRMLKPIKEKLVDDFIHENLDLKDFYLYRNNDHYYLSLIPLIDLKKNVLKYGIYLGKIINKRFEPSHNLYRADSLLPYFKYSYDLSDDEYQIFVSGNEIKKDMDKHYYLLTYKGYPLGFAKSSNGSLKNKYPKGLRRML